MPKRSKKMSRKKTAGLMANRTLLAAIVGLIIIGGGVAYYFFLMPGDDANTWTNATEVIRDRGGYVDGTVIEEEGIEEEEPLPQEEIDEMLFINPVNLLLYGIDGEGGRHRIIESSAVAQSAYLGDIEIFDVELDIYWNLAYHLSAYPEDYIDGVDVKIVLSVVDSAVLDTAGNQSVDASPVVFESMQLMTADSEIGYMTFSLVNDVYGNFSFTDINDVNAMVIENLGINMGEVSGMLTFKYGVLGFYLVNGLGSAENRALKRMTITTEPVVEDTGEIPVASAFSVYNIGEGVETSDLLVVVGLGLFSMIMIYYYLNRRR